MSDGIILIRFWNLKVFFITCISTSNSHRFCGMSRVQLTTRVSKLEKNKEGVREIGSYFLKECFSSVFGRYHLFRTIKIKCVTANKVLKNSSDNIFPRKSLINSCLVHLLSTLRIFLNNY